MHIAVLQENIQKTFQEAGHFIANKPQIPVLSGAYLHAAAGQLTLRTTDLRVGLQTSVGAKVMEEGECVLPLRICSEFIGSLVPGMMEMKTDGDSLLLSQGKRKAKVPLFPLPEYPPFPETPTNLITLPKNVLQSLVDAVLYASSSDETRPVLASTLMELDDQLATLVCTDGYRLSVMQKELGEALSAPISVLIPSKGLTELSFIVSKAVASDVKLGIAKELSQAFFVVGDSTVLIRLTEGQFPPYKQVIPTTWGYETVLDRKELLTALKSALVFAKETSSIVNLSFEQQSCTLRSASVSVGDQESVIDSSTPTDEKKHIAFNGKFLYDVLSHMECDRVRFRMTDELKPGLFLPEEAEYPLCVVMPFKR